MSESSLDARAQTVRIARPADAAALAPLVEKLEILHARAQPGFFRDPPATEGAREARLTRTRLALSRTSERWFVAPVASEIVGFARAYLVGSPADPSLRPRRRLHLDSLWTEPSARRNGHGRALVEAASAWGKERGAEQIILTVWEGNDEACAFYSRLGFSTVSRAMTREP